MTGLLRFGRYSEVVNVNLGHDKGTRKSKDFVFLAYEDQRSTILAIGKHPFHPSFYLWSHSFLVLVNYLLES